MPLDLSGRHFGDFRIKSWLGAGQGGVVYLAEQLTLGREVAVKVLDRASEANAARFLREVKLAAKLDHPFAAHVYAFGVEADQTPWIAMELVRGTTVDRLIATHGRLALARLVPLLDRIAEVLTAAHDQGIVHRDVKPANVMVIQRAGRWLPKLLDLGIARTTYDDHAQDDSGDISLDDVSDARATLDAVDSMQLTRQGATVGTPLYMAPEQWLRASSVDGRADVYSLALLAYECLTGRPAFQAARLREIARCHARDPVPLLGPEFPTELDAVLAKGAAKRPNDRYRTALEFAAEFRTASGVGVTATELPQLPSSLRDNVLVAAPQPIAETFELWEAARTPKTALEAIERLVEVTVRYIALLALAGRLRVGPGGARDDEDALRSFATLRVDRPAARDWLALAVALARKFESHPEAHPLPELVHFLIERTGGVHHAIALFDLLDGAVAVNDQDAVPKLFTASATLAKFLDGASFVFDYRVIVWRGHGEVWMGTRRTRRLVATVADPPRSLQTVLLVDPHGARVLSLDPLVQCLAPSGGAPDELFLFDGTGRNGARLVTWPGGFERYDDSLWDVLAAAGLPVHPVADPTVQELSPYKGLATFGSEDADNYFGREREAEAFANRIRTTPFLAVVGPSGTGKSSFVLAGVLPLLPPEWKPIVFRPSSSPISTWQARTAAAGVVVPITSPDAFVAALPTGETWVFVVDQFEELVTLCGDPSERRNFANALLAAAQHPSGRIRVVVTLRDDFLIAVQQLGPFTTVLSSSVQLLGTPAPENLQRVITEPARRAGYAFDDAGLPASMVEEVIDKPGALALLSFTASQMWELRDRELRLMRSKTYRALGGVGGALAHHAEATLAAMSDSHRAVTREAFRHLVTAQGTRAVLSKIELEELVGGTAAGRPVIDALVNARLLVTSEATASGDTIEIIHEALITAWPRLVAWQREDAESMRIRDALRASARQWAERGKPSGLLWRKEALAEFKTWRPRFAGRLTRLESEFAAASLRDEARARRLRRAALALVVVSLATGLGIASRSWLAEKHRLAGTWAEQARTAMLADRPMDALVYTAASERSGGAGSTLDQIAGAAAIELSGAQRYLGHVDRRLRTIHASSDEHYALEFGDGEFALFDIVAGRKVATWNLPCEDGGFSRESDAIVLSCVDGELRIVALPSLQMREVPRPEKLAGFATFSADGRYIAPFVTGDTVTAFTFDGSPVFSATIPKATTLSFVFSPRDGAAVISGDPVPTPDSFSAVELVDGRGEVQWKLTLPSPAIDGEFSPDGKSLALSLVDHSVAMIDMDRQAIAWMLRAHSDTIWGLHFDGEGKRLLTVAEDGFIRILDASTGQNVAMPPSPGGAVRAGAWLPGDHEVAIAAAAGRLWRIDATTGQPVWTYHGHAGDVRALVVLPRSGELISGATDGMLWAWPIGASSATSIDSHVAWMSSKPGNTMFVSADDFRVEQPGLPSARGVLALHQPTLALVDSGGDVVAIADGSSLYAFVRHGGTYERKWQRELPTTSSGVAVASDGAMVAVIDNTGLLLVLDRDGHDLARLMAAKNNSATVVFDSHDHVVVGCHDGHVRVYEPHAWRLELDQEIHTLQVAISHGVHPHELVSWGYDNVIKVWSDDNWTTPIHELHVPIYPNGVVISADGRFAAVAEAGPRVTTYDLGTKQPVSVIALSTPTASIVPGPDRVHVLVVDTRGAISIPAFPVRPDPELTAAIEACRVTKTLDGQTLVDRVPACSAAQASVLARTRP